MPRQTLYVFFVIALTLMALAVALNRATFDPATHAAESNETVSSGGLWSDVDAAVLHRNTDDREIIPVRYRTLRLDMTAMQTILSRAPMEFTDAARKVHIELVLPLPDGKFGKFRIVEAPIMEPALAAKFPELKTYSGQGIDDPTATLRFDTTPFGFHAQVLSAQDSVYIDPFAKGDTEHYISYFKHDLRKDSAPFECMVGSDPETGRGVEISKTQMTVPPNGAFRVEVFGTSGDLSVPGSYSP